MICVVIIMVSTLHNGKAKKKKKWETISVYIAPVKKGYPKCTFLMKAYVVDIH